MDEVFSDGQLIRHKGTCRTEWIGVYNKEESIIIYNGKKYTSISGFAEDHYKIERPDRVHQTNGWVQCQWKVNGVWSFFNEKIQQKRKSVNR